MSKNFNDREHFDAAFEAVSSELVIASVYFDLFKALDDSFDDYKYEISQAPAFWNITRDLHLSAAIIGLCRVYDTHHESNNLALVLRAISHAVSAGKNDTIFEPLTLDGLDINQLASDIQFTDSKNQHVRKLLAWRGSMFVHSNLGIATKRKEFPKLLQPHIQDFEFLLTGGLEIVNRYGNVLYSKENGTSLIGKEDYTFVLDCVRTGLAAFDKERSEQLKEYGVNPDVFRRRFYNPEQNK